MEGCLGAIIVGILAGYIAGKIMRGGGFGCIWNLVLGVVGGLVGGYIFKILNVSWGGLIGEIGTAVVGAVAVLWVAGVLKKK